LTEAVGGSLWLLLKDFELRQVSMLCIGYPNFYLEVDLGLDVTIPEDKRRNTDCDTKRGPTETLLANMAKLTLANSLQGRAIRSILMEVVMVDTESLHVTAGLAAGKAFAEAAKATDAKAREATPGLPHSHVWNAFLKTTVDVLKDKEAGAKHDTINRYIQQNKDTTWQLVSETVKYCKIACCYDNEKKEVEVNIVMGSPAGQVWTIIREQLLQRPGATLLLGQAPAGYLERQLQEWLETLS